ncbi:serine/threonine-protein kinase [Rhizohabitans arisaemae]|uniref:serine/threonine-protein kinase n=1 Tax=Rhizohabitans arisaemae TaxID=2720610 RepID=UPI0024B1DA21|nr:serine/threonine protein kinase [Rhizohabitans arisaemae]
MTTSRGIEVPGYQVLGVLGQGGFGVVYRARQLSVGREVALKVDNRVLLSERDQRRFLREVNAVGALSGHPHVVEIYDAGVLHDGRPYIVLELCTNGSLNDRLRGHGPFAPAEVRDIGVRVADALAAAHAHGVLHRDVKPANILINRYGMVALADFGLAAMPVPGQDLSVTLESLTPAFAPPEAFELAGPSPLGDVYSLAASLYALLSGRPPRFPPDGVPNVAVILALHRQPIPDIPGVPPMLTEVLRRGMHTDPATRLSGAAALRDALAAVPLSAPEAGRPHHAAPTGPPPGYGPTASRSASGELTASHAAALPSGPAGVDVGTPPGGLPIRPGVSRRTGSPPGGPVPAGSPGRRSRTTEAEHRTRPPAAAQRTLGRDRRGALRSGRVTALIAALGVVLILGALGAVALGALEEGIPGASPSTITFAPGAPAGDETDYGTPTVTAGCAAAKVSGARARCVKTAECWSGLVVILGKVDVKRRGCEEAHAWETFAIAPLPIDAITNDLDDLERHPQVKRVCAKSVLLASRLAAARAVPVASWDVSVLPPTQGAFDRGVRVYRCVGTVVGRDGPGSFFRPRT